MKFILTLQAALGAMLLSAGSAYADMISFTGDVTFAIAHHYNPNLLDPPPPSKTKIQGIPFIDDTPYTVESDIPGSLSRVTTLYETIDDNTLSFTVFWDFTRGAGAEFGNATHSYGSI